MNLKLILIKKQKMKRTFLVITERDRVRGKISFYISELKENGLNLIDNDLRVSINSHHGIAHEAVRELVRRKKLPENVLDSEGYILDSEGYIDNYDRFREDYNFIYIDGQGLNYVNQI